MKLVAIMLSLFLIAGCASTPGSVQEAGISAAIELAGYNLGYYVGKSKSPDDDRAIADAYTLARTGNLPPAELAAAFSKFKIENAQLAGSLQIVLKRMGASFTPDGTLESLSGIPKIYWDTAAEGYISGYEFGKLGQKAMPSAVKAVWLKR